MFPQTLKIKEKKERHLALTENRNVFVTRWNLAKPGSVKTYHPAWEMVQAASSLSEESCAELHFPMCANMYNTSTS